VKLSSAGGKKMETEGFTRKYFFYIIVAYTAGMNVWKQTERPF
jgi:hypothetical protein